MRVCPSYPQDMRQNQPEMMYLIPSSSSSPFFQHRFLFNKLHAVLRFLSLWGKCK